MSRSRLLLFTAIGALAFGLPIAGCGGDDSTSSSTSAAETTAADEDADVDAPPTATTDAPADQTLEITMSDFAYDPASTSTSAGAVEISAPNEGAVTHELVLAKTDLDAAKLPTDSTGEVVEDDLDVPGEIPDVAAGASASATLDLKPGKYVYFCNLPGHYAQGMYGSLTVKGG